MAEEVARRPAVDSLGHDLAFDAERLEGGHLLGLGREPRQVRVFEDVVEREEPSHEYFRGSDPSSAPVPGAERPVDLASVNSAHAAEASEAGRVLLDGHALRDKLADNAAHLLVVATQKGRSLRPGEDSAVETGQRDPLGPAASPAEGLQRLRAFLQVDSHSRCYSPLPFAVEPVRRWTDRMVAYGNFGTPSVIRKPRQSGGPSGYSIRPQEKKRRNDRRTSSIFSVLRAPIRLAMSEECIVNSLVAFTIDGLGSRPSAKSPRQRWTACSGHP